MSRYIQSSETKKHLLERMQLEQPSQPSQRQPYQLQQFEL